MAMSLNGIIARSNGDEDFLSVVDWENFSELTEKTGCLITSRKTYENVKNWNDKSFDDINAIKIVVSKKSLKLNESYLLVNSPEQAIKEAKRLSYKEVIISAGPDLIKSFMDKNLIDEIIINIDPVLVGKGIELLKKDISDKKLKLIGSKNLDGDIVQLSYKIIK